MPSSLRARLLAAFLLPTLALLAAAGAVGYQSSRNLLEDELGRSLAAQAAAVAASLNAERLMALGADDAAGEGSRVYRSLSRQLAEARAALGARRVLAFDAAGTVRLDAGGVLPFGAEVPELARDRLELQQVLSGRVAFSQVLFEGLDGRWYKPGYAPLRHEGAVVGAVAVEGSAEFFGPLQTLGRAALALLALTAVVLALTAVVTASGVTRPLDALVRAALRIGQGDLRTAVQPQPTREIGILARELEAMRQALEGRDRQLKLMLGGVAHEVKNPLGGIELFAGLLGEELAAPAPNVSEARSHVAKVQRELQYLKRIVDDFLAFAREQPLQRSAVEAGALLSSAAALLEADAQARSVRLAIDAQAASLRVDVSLLTAALVNLVKNAVQASPAGETVQLTGRRDGERYRFAITNAGELVPPELQARIFEPFFTTRAQGTGLGLPLARKIVDAHRGSLSVQSRPGCTTFTVELGL